MKKSNLSITYRAILSSLFNIHLYKWLIVIILVGSTNLGQAFRLTGTIQGLPDNQVLVGADCVVKIGRSGDPVRSTSDEAGVFVCEWSRELVANDSIVINVSKPGYESVREAYLASGDSIQDIGVIFLNQVNMLNEVTVDAKTVTVKDGNYLYNPPKSIIESSNYAVDLVGRLGVPGVIYSPLSQSLSDISGSMLILVDGVESNQEELKSLKSSDVLNVEYSHNVPLMYASQYKSVLNVRMKKRDNGGSWNIQDQNDFIGSAVDAATAFRYYQGPSRFMVNYNFSYRHYHQVYDTNTISYLAPELQLETKTDSRSPFNYKINSASFQYKYAPSPAMVFMATYSINGYNTLRKSFKNIDDTLNGEYTGNERTHQNNLTNNLNLYFSKGFGQNNSLDISVNGNYNNQDYESNLRYDMQSDVTDYANALNSKRYALNGISQYTHVFNDRSRLSASYGFTVSHTRNNYHLSDRLFDMNEANQNIYVQYQRIIGSKVWMLLRTGLKIDHLTENGSPHTYYNNLSAISFQYAISQKFNLEYTGNFNTTTLQLSLLQDNPVQVNPYLINNGNSNLKPYNILSNRVQLSFANNNYSLSLLGTNYHFFDPIYSTPIYDSELKAYLSRPENCKYFDSTSAMLSANIWDLFKMFQIGGYISYYHMKFENNNGWKNKQNTVGGNIWLNWIYKKFVLGSSVSFLPFGLNGYDLGYLEGDANTYMIQGEYRPTPNLSLGLQWFWMFDKKGWVSKTETQAPQYHSSTERQIRNNSNWVRFTLSYNLNFGKTPKTQDRQQIIDAKDSQRTFTDYSAK
ncbi:MAG: TonB-dependent receptor family protein [Muribaculaceae bacterium]|nr:TonB-dependent receptor family protein [Muribaculaceae bacterium]